MIRSRFTWIGIRREIEYPVELPYGKMAPVNAMVAAQQTVKDEPGAFAQALANGRAFD
jgi:hypothetical protein